MKIDVNFWPIQIDMHDYFPMEYLLESDKIDRDNLSEIKFDIVDVPIEKNGELYETSMETGDGIYRTHFRQTDPNVFEVTFRWDREKLSVMNIAQYINGFSSGTESTDNREPFRIFSFVISSVLSFIKKKNPAVIHLTSNESKKVNSYHGLVHNIASEIGWKVYDEKTAHDYRAIIVNPERNNKT